MLASYPGHVSEGKVAWYPLFAHARTIPEIFREQVRIRTSYTWLLCGEITKLDIRLAVWELCLRGDRFSLSSGGFRGGKGGANAPPLAASSVFLRT